MASRLTNAATKATPDLLPATGRHRTRLFARYVDGRGLLTVSATAASWGAEERTGSGKCVWAASDRNTRH
ncbi:hypothetical protein [Actinacidiphila sp. bgisy145]|uniref:hypothetical protein n=1 Tax=Actinacidiphila sp. bgisy145 TaxID=3413792 RepID=UPI003EB89E59